MQIEQTLDSREVAEMVEKSVTIFILGIDFCPTLIIIKLCPTKVRWNYESEDRQANKKSKTK